MSLPLLEELKRRRVFRAVVGYAIAAFAVLQVAEPVMHGLHWPDAVLSYVVVALALGFPLVVTLAWIFDVNAGRIERTPPAGGPRGVRGVRLAMLLAGIGLLGATPGLAWWYLRSGRGKNAAPEKSAAVAAAPAPSIAVLPFADLSPAKDQDWMCDGIAEEILNALFSVSGLRVAARSSSFQFKGRTADVREIGRTLGVTTLLEGSVRKAGERVRISARLVSLDGYELWSDTFERGLEDAFATQEEIARAVVRALQVRLSSPEESRLQRAGTRNPRAYELYLRGRKLLRGYVETEWEYARRMFKDAVELDPRFAQAHAGIADAAVLLLHWQLVPRARQEPIRVEALSASEEALRLEPQLGEAHVAHGNVLFYLGRAEEADAGFKRAIALSPGLADAWYFYGRFLFAVGRYAEAANAFEEAARRDPDEYQAYNLLPMTYRNLGDLERGRAAARRALEAIERRLRSSPDDVRALYLGGGFEMYLGNRERGFQYLERAVALQPRDFSTLYNVACGYAIAGEKERALDFLDRAVDTSRGFRPWMERDSDLNSLRDSPRFRQILARLPP